MEAFETTSIEELTAEQLTEARDRVLDQIRWCRQYTLQLIESIDERMWYVKPAGCETHVAWQVGHLAVSQYGLMLFRQRGRAEGDQELMPSWLRKKFGRGTQPADSAAGMPEPSELLDRLSAIHQQGLSVASQLPAATLAEPIDLPLRRCFKKGSDPLENIRFVQFQGMFGEGQTPF
jgi:hypothetical protein